EYLEYLVFLDLQMNQEYLEHLENLMYLQCPEILLFLEHLDQQINQKYLEHLEVPEHLEYLDPLYIGSSQQFHHHMMECLI
ncbi:MAG: hypothetical protein EBX37_17420, partial [Alphaproteobacteria bacterium]|nr:hypothetical protein [Alphaproteobacteria bacterium]